MGLGPPAMPEIKMPPPPPPPAPMDQPDVVEPELQGGRPDEKEPKNTGSKRKTRVYNKRKGGSSKYKGGGLNAL